MTHRLTPALALLALLLFSGAPAPLYAGAEVLEKVFAERSVGDRRAIQIRLAQHALFTGIADGAWTPGTQRALLRAADQIRWHLRDERGLDLNHLGAARSWIGALLDGEYDDALPRPPSARAGLFDFLSGR